MVSEFERWRERQLDEYQRAQIIDRLDRQRLLDEYQGAQAIDRLDQQNAGLSQLGSILADAGTSVGLIQADISRLLAVTDQVLPVIIDRLALVGARLAEIAQLLASPRETEAWELFRSGSRALTSAIEMSERGSPGLSSDWLDEAIKDLSHAVETYQHRPEFWFHLGLAHARRGPSEDAAEALSRCARYAASTSPGLAAESVLLAAAQFRSIGQRDRAKDLLHKFLPPLDRCAEIHLNLAAHHGESERLTRALELAPLLASVARAAEVASVESAAAEVCRHEDGPVSRLRALEKAILALTEAAKGLRLNYVSKDLPAVTLPDFGVNALLKAEVNIPLIAEEAKRLVNDVMTGLGQLEREVERYSQQYEEAKAHGAEQIRDAQEQATQAKEMALKIFEAPIVRAMWDRDRWAKECSEAEEELQQAISNAVAPERTLEAYTRVYDESGKMRADALVSLRLTWRARKNNWKAFDGGDDYYLYQWFASQHGESTYAAYEWAKCKPRSMWTKSVDNTHVLELVLCMVGEEGDEIRAKSEDARQAIEHAKGRVHAAQEATAECARTIEQTRHRLDEGEARMKLHESEQEADRICQRYIQQVEETVRSAGLEYNSARDASQHATEVMDGFLGTLEATIHNSTASRNRIIASV